MQKPFHYTSGFPLPSPFLALLLFLSWEGELTISHKAQKNQKSGTHLLIYGDITMIHSALFLTFPFQLLLNIQGDAVQLSGSFMICSLSKDLEPINVNGSLGTLSFWWVASFILTQIILDKIPDPPTDLCGVCLRLVFVWFGWGFFQIFLQHTEH